MTYNELIQQTAALNQPEIRKLRNWICDSLTGYTVREVDIPQNIRLLLWRHTNALKANARWRRFESTVMHYVTMFRDGDITTLLLEDIKIRKSNCTVPDGMTRLAALIICAQPYVMLVRGVTDEQAEAIGKYGGDDRPRPLSDRFRNFCAEVEPKSTRFLTPVIKSVKWAENGIYKLTDWSMTLSECREAYLIRKKTFDWVWHNFKNIPKSPSALRRVQVKAGFVFLRERDERLAERFLKAFRTNNCDENCQQAAALFQWLANENNIRRRAKSGERATGTASARAAVFYAVSYCMISALRGKRLSRVHADKNYFLDLEATAPDATVKLRILGDEADAGNPI